VIAVAEAIASVAVVAEVDAVASDAMTAPNFLHRNLALVTRVGAARAEVLVAAMIVLAEVRIDAATKEMSAQDVVPKVRHLAAAVIAPSEPTPAEMAELVARLNFVAGNESSLLNQLTPTV
jgi:hypothetical protein